MSRPFSFKQFSVTQQQSAFKVGTDSVVLGAWARIDRAAHILDIGTGTGLLALMCAQRNAHASVTAIEKDGASATEAGNNFAASPWAERLQAVHIPLADYLPAREFDYIICNPPYFLQALRPADARKADARHADGRWFTALARKADAMAAEQARFGCILPVKEYEYLGQEWAKLGWHGARVQRLLPYPGGEKVRILAEWTRQETIPEIRPDLYVRNAGRGYDDAYTELTRDFYLSP